LGLKAFQKANGKAWLHAHFAKKKAILQERSMEQLQKKCRIIGRSDYSNPDRVEIKAKPSSKLHLSISVLFPEQQVNWDYL